MGIGAHQPAAAQQNPAEIAGHHHRAVGQILLTQHIQHRHTGSALRLPIIGKAAQRTALQHIGIHIVPRIPILLCAGTDKGLRLFLGADRLHRPDKARALFGKLVLGGRGHRAVCRRQLLWGLRLHGVSLLFCGKMRGQRLHTAAVLPPETRKGCRVQTRHPQSQS